MKSDYSFDENCDEEIGEGISSIEFNFKKINAEEQRRRQMRDFIINHQNLSAFRDEVYNNGSVSSGSVVSHHSGMRRSRHNPERNRSVSSNQLQSMSDLVS